MAKKKTKNPNETNGEGSGGDAEVPAVLSFGQQEEVSLPSTDVPVPAMPKPILHQRDVSALTTFADDVPTPPRPRPMHHKRGISVDLTRRVASVPQREAEPDLPPHPPRAGDVRASVTGLTGTETANTIQKRTTWGAASKLDSKVVGLGAAARYSAGHHAMATAVENQELSKSQKSRKMRESVTQMQTRLEQEELDVRDHAMKNPWQIMIVGGIAAIKVRLSCVRLCIYMYLLPHPFGLIQTLLALTHMHLAFPTGVWYISHHFGHCSIDGPFHRSDMLLVFHSGQFAWMDWWRNGLDPSWFRRRYAPLTCHRNRVPTQRTGSH